MPSPVPFRTMKDAHEHPIVAKLSLIENLDPGWLRELEALIDWKLADLKRGA